MFHLTSCSGKFNLGTVGMQIPSSKLKIKVGLTLNPDTMQKMWAGISQDLGFHHRGLGKGFL